MIAINNGGAKSCFCGGKVKPYQIKIVNYKLKLIKSADYNLGGACKEDKEEKVNKLETVQVDHFLLQMRDN